MFGRAVVALTAVSTLAGCGSAIDRLIARAELEQLDVQGETFLHRNLVRHADGERVFVFIDGDGKPWSDAITPSTDPTPRDPLGLRLMLRTPGPVAYVGRPCYWQIVDPACEPLYWTHGRFAPEVVASMRAAVDAVIDRFPGRECTIVGHSGGAALALLIAPELAHRCSIVTVAGLVDTAAWTDWLRYEPLTDSLNPADMVARLVDIPQIHLVGLRDRNIPAEQTKRALAALPNAAIVEYERFDHGCCWVQAWRSILPRIRGADGEGSGGEE